MRGWLLAALALVGVVLGALLYVGGGAALDWWTGGRHVAQISATARVDSNECPEINTPVLIRLRNGSSRTLVRWDLDLVAKRPGRSTDLTQENRFTGDHIVAPGRELTMCGGEQLMNGTGDDPRSLEWSVRLLDVGFSD